ncbi:protein of unknown function [Pseudoalteromonas carrageenovora IAM 12662]|uniref:Uncharacterized protein n=1 Tax=Pseudoalteromonas carrageenovora IAM 12662 TaxID=1314868 RepID=A0A2K4XB11_PSEVC|nr:protein of unknown function [Pseudoalteromonas carrageenovora IAM 12662]
MVCCVYRNTGFGLFCLFTVYRSAYFDAHTSRTGVYLRKLSGDLWIDSAGNNFSSNSNALDKWDCKPDVHITKSICVV